MFCYIFLSFAGVSGGDMAIIAFNVIFGIIQTIIIIAFSLKMYGEINREIILAVFLIQIVELLIFTQWGYVINEFIKNIKTP